MELLLVVGSRPSEAKQGERYEMSLRPTPPPLPPFLSLACLFTPVIIVTVDISGGAPSSLPRSVPPFFAKSSSPLAIASLQPGRPRFFVRSFVHVALPPPSMGRRRRRLPRFCLHFLSLPSLSLLPPSSSECDVPIAVERQTEGHVAHMSIIAQPGWIGVPSSFFYIPWRSLRIVG